MSRSLLFWEIKFYGMLACWTCWIYWKHNQDSHVFRGHMGIFTKNISIYNIPSNTFSNPIWIIQFESPMKSMCVKHWLDVQ